MEIDLVRSCFFFVFICFQGQSLTKRLENQLIFDPNICFSYISIYKFGLSVCLFVSNKRQNGWTDRAQIFCGTSRDHREGLWMIKISNIYPYQTSIFIKFLKILKIHEIFCENPRIIFVMFYDVHKENMFTINLEDGREAP